MNKFGKWTGCRKSVAHISPMSLLSPVSPIGPVGYFWTALGETLMHLNTFLMAFNASVTDFLTHDFQRLTDLTDFNAS
jgi:hypothetical protein